jgi:hypothetical protein
MVSSVTGVVMENDSIRASGTDTLVDVWIDGKVRAICITREAIGAYLDFDRAGAMSDDDRCDFVKNNLALVLKASKARLRDEDPTANNIVIDAGHLARPDGKATDRRQKERRRVERRKSTAPLAGQPDRRRAPRRRGERRTRPPKSEG